MKSKLSIFFLSLVVSAALPIPPALAGEKVGNGGVAVVCRDARGSITSAEILDLFEGRNQFGLRYPETYQDDSLLVQLAQLKMTSNPAFLGIFRKTLSRIQARFVFLPRGVGLIPTDDAFPTIRRKGCAFEQLANYKDEEAKIYVDDEIYSHLSAYDRAALTVHETVYKIARMKRAEVSSVRSRKLTAELLAINSDQDEVERLMNELFGRRSPSLPSPVPLPYFRNGLYRPESALCDLRIRTSGETLVATWHGTCYSSGQSVIYKWNPVNRSFETSEGRAPFCSKGFSCYPSIEVLDSNAFILHSGDGTHSLFSLYRD